MIARFGFLILVAAEIFMLCLGGTDVVIKKLEVTDGTVPIVRLNDIQAQKFNRTTYVLNGKFALLRTMDFDLKIDVYVHYYKGTVEVHKYTILIDRVTCECIPEDIYVWPYLVENTNISKYCPIEAKEYLLNNFFMDGKNLPPALPGGTYELEIIFKLEGKEVQRAKFFVDLIKY